jgi:hypothetical protein
MCQLIEYVLLMAEIGIALARGLGAVFVSQVAMTILESAGTWAKGVTAVTSNFLAVLRLIHSTNLVGSATGRVAERAR